MRVLVADDDPGTLTLLENLLQSWGYEVLLARDGEETWAQLEGPARPQMALLDWIMPDPDGAEICRRLRRIQGHEYVYVILVTARTRKEDVTAGLEAGADDYVMKPFDADELRARLRVGERVLAFAGGLVAANSMLRTMALTDELTGLLNRGAILARLDEEHARHGRTGVPMSLLMVDIDHFKDFNDTFGHVAGDSVLAAVGHTLRGGCRPYDVVGRYGGEEFLVLLPAADDELGHFIAQRLRHIVEQTHVPFDGRQLRVRVSIGSATLRGGLPKHAGTLLRAADAALYRAKGRGRNRVSVAMEKDYREED